MHTLQEANPIHDFDGQPWPISFGRHKVVSKLSDTCIDWCQRPRIHTYWIKTGRFQPADVNKIKFTTAGAALQQEQPHARRWVTKLFSGYCGVNRWMYRWKK
jgi:hypothetical protein